ncbi:hypothetical protein CMV_023850 [Castanea mollissima]|uniref:Uncharacterized protein n=1 Tax=Castanea mollissima TaxID=60419 RepID=A0A8J4QNS1_9ROSI|nr:hypothetical protein CMV_023850 [Castanea mollissima]
MVLSSVLSIPRMEYLKRPIYHEIKDALATAVAERTWGLTSRSSSQMVGSSMDKVFEGENSLWIETSVSVYDDVISRILLFFISLHISFPVIWI